MHMAAIFELTHHEVVNLTVLVTSLTENVKINLFGIRFDWPTM